MASKPLNLTLTIDKSTNRVVFAEADKDFVDILLSFLTLPLATVVGLANNKAPPCLNNLYKSLKDLSDEYVKPNPGKEILLSPNHGAELDCLDLKVNIEGDRALTYYTCRQNCDAKLISPYSNTRCDCGGLMNRKVKLVRREKGRNENEGVFLKGVMRFIITDDFVIMPASTQAGLMLIGRLGMEEMSNLQERTITVGQSEVLALLQNSLASDTAFTDTFLPKELLVNYQKKKISLKYNPNPNADNNISFKIIIDKHENKVLYAEGNEIFADLLFSFLIYPSGSVVKFLNKKSHITCFDNLYASALNLSDSFKEYNTKEYLINPKLPSYYFLERSFNIFEEREMERYYMCRNSDCDSTKVSITPNVKCECGRITNKCMKLVKPYGKNFYNSEDFVHEATYIVTDDFVVTPLQSISFVTRLIANAKEGIKEMVVNVAEKEMLLLLEAALGSEMALTDAFLNYEEETQNE